MSIETYQQKIVSSVILKYLMGRGEAGLFVNKGEPQEVAPYRATTFFPDTNGRELVPCYRARFGGEVKMVQSNVRFRRDEAYAGIAWNNPGGMLVRPDLKTAADFGHDVTQWRDYWIQLIKSKRVVESMGSSSPYIQNTRSILSYCIEVSEGFSCVVCIDSTLANGFEDQYIRRIYHARNGGAGRAIQTGLLWAKDLAGHARVPLMSTPEVDSQIPISVFISHAKADQQLVTLIVNYLEKCFVIPDGALRCTSIDGYELEVGSRTSETLRQELEAADVVLGIITKQSLESGYVLMELGAAWGRGKTVCCLLGDDVEYEEIPGPLVENHAGKIKHAATMANLLEVIVSKTRWQKRNTKHCISAQKNLEQGLAVLERSVPPKGASRQKAPTLADLARNIQEKMSPKPNAIAGSHRPKGARKPKRHPNK